MRAEAVLGAAQTLERHTMEARSEQIAEDNRRSERRIRCYRGGRIVFNQGYGVFDCVIRNTSSGGAMLEFGSLVGVPSHFDLHRGPGEAPLRCHVKWRSATRLGVAFER